MRQQFLDTLVQAAFYQLHPGELSLLVSDPDPGDGVDGHPVAALSVVRLQLAQVGGMARVWLPANTADLQEIQSVHVVQSGRRQAIFTSEKSLSSIFPKYLSNNGIIGAPGNRSGS